MVRRCCSVKAAVECDERLAAARQWAAFGGRQQIDYAAAGGCCWQLQQINGVNGCRRRARTLPPVAGC